MPPVTVIDPKKDFNAETLLSEHGKDISGLGERLGKCYSKENYAEFQKEVETIVERAIKGESRKTTIEIATEAAKAFYLENAWKQKTFWIPTLISAGLFVIAILALFKH